MCVVYSLSYTLKQDTLNVMTKRKCSVKQRNYNITIGSTFANKFFYHASKQQYSLLYLFVTFKVELS